MTTIFDAAADGTLLRSEDLDKYRQSSISFDIDAIDAKGRTALSYAASKGHVGVIKLLTSQGADVNKLSKGDRSPLWYATTGKMQRQDRIEIITSLVESGATVDAQASDGYTPLMKVIEDQRDADIISYLVDHGASTKVRKFGPDGPTVEDVANIVGDPRVIRALKPKSLRITPRVEMVNRILSYILFVVATVNEFFTGIIPNWVRNLFGAGSTVSQDAHVNLNGQEAQAKDTEEREPGAQMLDVPDSEPVATEQEAQEERALDTQEQEEQESEEQELDQELPEHENLDQDTEEIQESELELQKTRALEQARDQESTLDQGHEEALNRESQEIPALEQHKHKEVVFKHADSDHQVLDQETHVKQVAHEEHENLVLEQEQPLESEQPIEPELQDAKALDQESPEHQEPQGSQEPQESVLDQQSQEEQPEVSESKTQEDQTLDQEPEQLHEQEQPLDDKVNVPDEDAHEAQEEVQEQQPHETQVSGEEAQDQEDTQELAQPLDQEPQEAKVDGHESQEQALRQDSQEEQLSEEKVHEEETLEQQQEQQLDPEPEEHSLDREPQEEETPSQESQVLIQEAQEQSEIDQEVQTEQLDQEPQANQELDQEVQVAQAPADPKAEIISYLAEVGLSDFFARDDVFVQQVAEKAAALKDDSSNLLKSDDDIRGLATLALYQSVLYCDDSTSMWDGTRIQDQVELVKHMSRISTRLAPEGYGSSIQFLNSSRKLDNNLPSDKVAEIISNVRPVGSTQIGTSLKKKILEPHVYQVLHESNGKLDRPVLVSCIIDGHPTGEAQEEFQNAILDCIDFLEKKGYKRTSVLYQICQIGCDQDAESFFNGLRADDRLRDVLYCPTERLDEEYRTYENAEDLERWVLKTLLRPVAGSQC